jgi:hypothetical protein
MATIIQAATASLTDIPNPAPAPQAPKTLEQTGLRADLIEQLLVKTLYRSSSTRAPSGSSRCAARPDPARDRPAIDTP